MESYFTRPCTLWYKSTRVWRRRGELCYLCGLVILVYIGGFCYYLEVVLLLGVFAILEVLLFTWMLYLVNLATLWSLVWYPSFGGDLGGFCPWCATLGDDSWLMFCYIWRWYLEDDDMEALLMTWLLWLMTWRFAFGGLEHEELVLIGHLETW